MRRNKLLLRTVKSAERFYGLIVILLANVDVWRRYVAADRCGIPVDMKASPPIVFSFPHRHAYQAHVKPQGSNTPINDWSFHVIVRALRRVPHSS